MWLLAGVQGRWWVSRNMQGLLTQETSWVVSQAPLKHTHGAEGPAREKGVMSVGAQWPLRAIVTPLR